MNKTLITAVVCACASATLIAPVPATAKAARTSKPSQQDATWVRSSIQTDLAEISGGKSAEQKSNNPLVTKLAKTLIIDHTKLLKRAEKLADRYAITIPTSPSAAQVAQASTVSTKTGKAFNLAYAKMEIDGHVKSIAQTKMEIAKGSNASIKMAAATALPMLKMHLQLAKAALKSSEA